jgi:hypothetical protein
MHFTNIFLLACTAVLALAAPLRKEKRVKNFKGFGVNESGTEFRLSKLPGTEGTDYR